MSTVTGGGSLTGSSTIGDGASSAAGAAAVFVSSSLTRRVARRVSKLRWSPPPRVFGATPCDKRCGNLHPGGNKSGMADMGV